MTLHYPSDGVAIQEACYSGFSSCLVDTFHRDTLLQELTERFRNSKYAVFAYLDSVHNFETYDSVYYRGQLYYIDTFTTEQVQVSIAPYDVRQGNFVGASVDTITRSGTNSLRASVYHRFRNEDFVGTEARGLVFNPGTFNTKNTGGWAGTPIVKNQTRLVFLAKDRNGQTPRIVGDFNAWAVTPAGYDATVGTTTRIDGTSWSYLESTSYTDAAVWRRACPGREGSVISRGPDRDGDGQDRQGSI